MSDLLFDWGHPRMPELIEVESGRLDKRASGTALQNAAEVPLAVQNGNDLKRCCVGPVNDGVAGIAV